MLKKAVVVPCRVGGCITCGPAGAGESGDQSVAEEAVTAIYNQVQRGCTPSMTTPFYYLVRES
jgi:hypothetical protein